MNTRRYSLRSALFVVGSIAVAAVSNGCNPSGEQTGKSAQDLADNGSGLRINLPPSLSAKTYPTSDNTSTDSASTCGATSVAPPTSLAAYGCTWGVAINGDSNLPKSTFPSEVQAYAWACPSTAAMEAAITVALDSGGSGTFGGPEVGAVITDVATADSCYGHALPGYEIVVEVPNPKGVFCPPPRGGGLDLPLHGVALSSKPGVNPYLVNCIGDSCDCGVGTPVVTE
jgi:hypothetical protein